MIPVPKELENDNNQDVFAYLSSASAHGDVAEELIKACSSLGELGRFCPDPSQFQYVTVYTRATIFGFATGMNTIAFRLGRALTARAIATGGKQILELNGWAAFELFRSDWPAVDLRFWATQAYVRAREPRGA